MYVLGDLSAFDKITEPRELIEINGLLSQVSHDNEPEACISGIELRVEKLEDQAFIYTFLLKIGFQGNKSPDEPTVRPLWG